MAKDQEKFNQLIQHIIDNDQHLTSIDLSNQELSKDDIEKLCTALQSNIIVNEINLSINNIGNSGAELLSIALADKKIAQLNLGLTRIGDSGIADLALALKELPLVTFNFAGNPITDKGSQTIINAFATHPTLLELRLDLCRIGDSLAHQICFLLSENKVIQSINLSTNRITAAGMQIIGQYIAHCPSLQKLYLLNNTQGEFFDASAYEICKFYSSSVVVQSADKAHPGMAITRSYDKVRATASTDTVISDIEKQPEIRKPRLKISY